MRTGQRATARLATALALVGMIALLTAPVGAQEDDLSGPSIVGGSVSAVGAHPHLVSIQRNDGHFCGGSVIEARMVLTAAHCFTDESGNLAVAPADLSVRVGSNDSTTGGTVIDVASIHLHPNWNHVTFVNDMAILGLTGAAGVAPIALARPGQESSWVPGTNATVAGWGATSEGGSGSTQLLEAEVPVISDADCTAAYSPIAVATSAMFCAGFLGVGEIDACQGDSGGPLIVDGPDDQPLQVGVVSWGIGCARPSHPGVYSRVSSYDTFMAPFLTDEAPANDDFADAQPLFGSAGTVVGTNFFATTQGGEPTHAGTGGSSVWYRWVAPASGPLSITTINSDFDTVLAVYTGGTVGSLTEIASNDDDPGLGRLSRVDFSATAGTTYHVAVDGFGARQGIVALNWAFSGAASCVADPSQLFFADVDTTNPFCADIQWMGTTGLSTGTAQPGAKPLYKPFDAISRQAMAAFLWRLEGEPAMTSSEPFFADVSAANPFFEAIQWMGQSGLSTGTPQPGGKPLYAPGAAISRQAMAAFLWRLAEEPAITLPTRYFADVNAANPFFEAVQWMGQSGVSTGTPQAPFLSRYQPASPVSRQAMAAFLFRFDASV